MGIIYKHTIAEESYVGYTKRTLESRLAEHIRAADNGVNSHFYNKIRKHGTAKIKSEIIEDCENSVLKDREIHWIKKLDTFNNGLNMTKGGDGGATRTGKTNSAEHRRKTSEAQLGKKKRLGNKCGQYKKSEEHKQKLSEFYLGRIWVSNIELKKQRQILKEELEAYLDNGYILGRKVTLPSKETKKKLSEYTMSEERKQQLSKMHTGKIIIHHPETQIVKMVFPEDYINIYKYKGFIRGRVKK